MAESQSTAVAQSGKKGLPPWLKPGNPGNRGNRQRADKTVEDACRVFYATGCLDALKEIITNPKEDAMARIKACEQIARVGRIIQPETALTLQDNRTYAKIEQVLYLPKLGSDVHQIPESVNGNGDHAE